jgi:cellulose synthase/poly-beta-1,6-N-acetylglucosamine synthase-like glycosyltransferase
MEAVFWIAVMLVAYAYLGYGALAAVLARAWQRPKAPAAPERLPSVSLVVAAYNEEDVILAKIANCFALEYPGDRLEIVIVTDGSTDRTPELAGGVTGVRVMHAPERRGKIHALNRVMPTLDAEIVVFSDANAMLNPEALRRIVRHFQDPRVAGVAGEKRIKPRADDVSTGEGFYWRYESALKRWDSRISSVMGAAGELVAVRREAYVPIENDTLLDDFVMSMRLVARGLRVVYEPEAYATEEASPTIAEEFKRKARIVAGGWQAVFRLWPLLIPTRPLIWLQYVSHRVLRWVLVPALLPIIFLSNMLLAWSVGGAYGWLLQLQLALYGAALLGWWLQERGIRTPVLYLPFYFAFLNAAALVGAYRFWTGAQSVTWEKARRAPRTTSL